MVLSKIYKTFLHLTLLLILACASKKTRLYLTAQRSEGLTTCMIEFYDDGKYTIKEGTFFGDDAIKGNYSIRDSIITLSNIGEQSFVKSKQLSLKDESGYELVLYQLGSSKKIDTTLFKFFGHIPEENSR